MLLLGAAAGQTLQLPTDELTLDLPVEPPSVAQPPAELVPVGMVEACFVRPGAVLAMVGHDGVVRADRCGQLVDQGLTARIARAKGALPVAPVPADPLPPGFVLGFLQALAPAAARLQGPAERQAANSLLVAAAGQLLRELPQEPAIDAAKQPSAALRRAMAGAGLLASTEAGITRATVVAGTLDAMMEYLTRAGAVEATAVAGRGDCGRSSCTACGGGAGSGGPAGWVLVQARRRCGAAIAALLASPAINVVEAAIGQQRQQLLPSSAAQQPRVLARATLRRPKAAVAQPSACWLLDLATPVVAAGGGGGERRSPLPLLPSRAACASSRGHRR